MATQVLTDAFVSINGVDLSDHVTQVTVNYSAQMLDDTAMGDDTLSNLGGLKEWNMSVELQQDFASGSVDATLFPIVGSTTTVIVRADKTSGVSTTNPNYTGTGIIASYPPLGNSVGELAATTVEIQSAGTLSRATA